MRRRATYDRATDELYVEIHPQRQFSDPDADTSGVSALDETVVVEHPIVVHYRQFEGVLAIQIRDVSKLPQSRRSEHES